MTAYNGLGSGLLGYNAQNHGAGDRERIRRGTLQTLAMMLILTVILSVCGALAHNIGQLLGAGVIISSSLSFYYAPVMLVLGLVMGALTSITLKALLPALGKMGFSTQEKRKED